MPPDTPSTSGRMLAHMRQRLAAAGNATPALDARLLLQHAAGRTHEQLAADPDEPLDAAHRRAAETALQRRLANEPVSRIIGQREFYGRRFDLTGDVLDPRADTETLIEAALAAARLVPGTGAARTLIDIGTGSGAIAVTLLCELPGWRAIASDISGACLDVARRNAERHGVADRLELSQTCWLEGIDAAADLIVSNPPYIPSNDIPGLAPGVRDHDPGLALDGGPDGLDAYRAIAPAAFARLRAGGLLLMETGAGQHDDVWRLMQAAGFEKHPGLAHMWTDLSGIVRVIAGCKQ